MHKSTLGNHLMMTIFASANFTVICISWNLEFRCRATSLLRKNDVFPGKKRHFLRQEKLKKVDLGGGVAYIYIYN